MVAPLLDPLPRDERTAQAVAVGNRAVRPGQDDLVADILVDLRAAFEGRVRDVAEEVVQQLVEQDRAQALGQPGRVAHVDQQEGPLLAARLHVAAGEQVLQRAEAQQHADLEHHVGPHRHDGREDQRGAERVVEPLVARDVQDAQQQQAAQDHHQVEGDLQAEIGQQGQVPQVPQQGALPLDLDQHDRRGDHQRADDADEQRLQRRFRPLAVAEQGADQRAAETETEEKPPGPTVALRLHHDVCIPCCRSLEIDGPFALRIAFAP